MLRRIDRELACEGGILEFCRDTVELPDGKIELWDAVHHKKGGGACAVPVLPDGRILMIRQMRPVIGKETLELPAGCRDAGEDTAETVKRELLEETGYRAGRITHLASVDTEPAWCDESTDIYLAEELQYEGAQKLDEAESILIEIKQPEELISGIFSGDIRDSKTVAGILAYREYCRKG